MLDGEGQEAVAVAGLEGRQTDQLGLQMTREGVLSGLSSLSLYAAGMVALLQFYWTGNRH